MESLHSLIDANPPDFLVHNGSIKSPVEATDKWTTANETSFALNKQQSCPVSNNYKLKYRSLLKRFQELQRDQEDTFTIHADTVIKLQEKIKQQDQALKRSNIASMWDARSDSEFEPSGYRVKDQKKTLSNKSNLRYPSTANAATDPLPSPPPAPVKISLAAAPESASHNAVGGNADQERLIEILKTKIDIMRLSMEEASRQYVLLHQQDQNSIAYLESQVAELTDKLNHSAHQVTVLTTVSTDLKRYLSRLLDGLKSTCVGLESHKKDHDQQLQQLREIYVSETQAGIEKNTQINQLHATINDKNREIAVLRGWLSRIKRDLRDKELKRSCQI